MARATSGLGQFRGKVGSVVFRVNQGQQIASAYQPSVRNPKSNLQTAQRSKMYLASQLSKLVPREDIIGLAPRGTARDRRAMFVTNILDNSVTVLGDDQIFASSIKAELLSFSKGFNLGHRNSGVSFDYDLSEEKFTISFIKNVISEEEFNRLAIKFINIGIVNGKYTGYKSSWLDLGTYDNTTQEEQFVREFNIAANRVGASIFYIIPVRLADNVKYSALRKTLVQYIGDNENELVVQGEYSLNNAVLEWGESVNVYVSTQGGEIVPPFIGGDEVVNPDGPNFPNLG